MSNNVTNDNSIVSGLDHITNFNVSCSKVDSPISNDEVSFSVPNLTCPHLRLLILLYIMLMIILLTVISITLLTIW